MTTNKKPIETIRFGRLSAAIWKNTGNEGKVFFSFTLERLYSDEDDKPQSTSSFNFSDALTVAKLADRAHTRIYGLMQAEKIDTE